MASNGDAAAAAKKGTVQLSDDMLREIFIRLPPAAVQRAGAACKDWRRVVNDKGFIASHRQRRAPNQCLFLYHRVDVDGLGLLDVELHAIDLAARRSNQLLRFAVVPNPHAPASALCWSWQCRHDATARADSFFRIEASCDGILLISYLHRLYACNPCTGHWRSLPQIHLHDGIVGFYGQDSPAGEREYRVLHKAGDPHINLSYRILLLGAEEPHDIGVPTSPGMHLLAGFLLLGGLVPSHRVPPTIVQGNLHWLFLSDRVIIVFDAAVQEFRWIGLPTPAADEYHHLHQFNSIWFQKGTGVLLEINDRLAMAIASWSGIRVWVRQDHAYGGAWVLRRQAVLPPAAGIHGVGLILPPARVVSEEQDVLVWRCPPHAILHCNAAGDVVTQYWSPDHRTIATPHMFQESRVEHAFLSRHVDDGYHGEPPFLLADEL